MQSVHRSGLPPQDAFDQERTCKEPKKSDARFLFVSAIGLRALGQDNSALGVSTARVAMDKSCNFAEQWLWRSQLRWR